MKQMFCIYLMLFFLFLAQVNADLDSQDLRIVQVLNRINLESEFDFQFLLNYSASDMKVFLNTCFARHGRPFNSRRMRDIFQNTSWYQVNPYYTDSLLTGTDRENVTRLRALLVLSNENETFLYQIKRGKKYTTPPGMDLTLEIVINREKDCFEITGTIPDPDNIWMEKEISADDHAVNIKTEVPSGSYGPDTWFIYNGFFYFFIEEIVEADMFSTYKVRRYLSCILDYTSKGISIPGLLAAFTEEF